LIPTRSREGVKLANGRAKSRRKEMTELVTCLFRTEGVEDQFRVESLDRRDWRVGRADFS